MVAFLPQSCVLGQVLRGRAGIIDEDVEFAENLLHGQERALDGLVVFDVELDRVDVDGRPERRRRLLALVRVAAPHQDLVVGRVAQGERLDDFIADARVAACHEDDGLVGRRDARGPVLESWS